MSGGEEVDQDNKAVAMNGRTNQLPYTVTVLNRYASSVVREEFVLAMAKPLPDLFKGENDLSKSILDAAEKLYLDNEA
mgnify:CR=1 FL=1